MISTASELTLSLATAFGVYMIAGGLSGIMGRERWTAILEGLEGNAALTYIASIFVYFLGVTLILVHNVWTDLLAGFISLVGWVAAVEGFVGIAFPKLLMGFASTFAKPGLMRGFAFGTIILGVLLTVIGLTGNVG